MKSWLMRAIEGFPVVGNLYRKLERRLFFRYVKRVRADAGRRLALVTNNTVSAGIFAGMKMDPQSAFGVDQFTILSGQYECELYEIVSDAAAKSYDAFIDVGCANGFYAVGFAMISKNCKVIAYDNDPKARRVTELNAKMNGVANRIALKEEANHSELQNVIGQWKNVFLLSDIEGAELDLIDPQKCPALSRCDLLVEIHGRTDEVADILIKRFNKTHCGRVIGRSPRNPFVYNDLPCEFEDEAWVTVSEGRAFSKNNWVLLMRSQVT